MNALSRNTLSATALLFKSLNLHKPYLVEDKLYQILFNKPILNYLFIEFYLILFLFLVNGPKVLYIIPVLKNFRHKFISC